MASEEYLDSGSEWFESEGWHGDGWYVVDANGIVAGVFDDVGEAMWWADKSARVA